MNEALKKAIIEKIREYPTIIISRHRRPDGDAIGSTYGLYRILRLTYPEKRVFLDNGDYSEYLAFMGGEGEKPTDEDYKEALVIVLDTGTIERISNPRALFGAFLIKIDHHIDDKPYGDLSLVEEERSSTCEMITDLVRFSAGEWKISRDAAQCLYVGMVTDSGRFRFRDVGGETLRNAAFLLDQGVDIETLYAELYMEEFDILRFEARMTERIVLSPNGVASLYIDRETRKESGMSLESASALVKLMEKIKGSLIWLCFIENDDDSIRVRLRSRFVEVQPLATRYHGGGHACAAGSTVYSKEEAQALLDEADALLGEYKKNNTGWL